MNKSSTIRKIAVIGNYLPRQCGIATFTTDFCTAITSQYPEIQCLAIPVNDIEGGYKYPPEVRFEIEENDLSSYRRAADFLNISDVDVVCLQHEFGIYGGVSGGYILALLRDLKMPVVTVLHTVLQEPSNAQRRVMEELDNLTARFVIMSQKAREFLQGSYSIAGEKIDVIPHGIPDLPFVDPNFYKDNFNVEGKTVLLTFGLLSPNKGIENVLNAMPAIVKAHPNVVYIVLGATHPNILRQHGDMYRISLERLAHANGIEENVIFHNRFVSLAELKEFIGAADLYITPYLSQAQIVSGTLAYSFGSGKAVISTPYWHAAELLAEGRGVLVPFKDPEAIARETIALLSDDARRHGIRKNAYMLGRDMVWSNVAHLFRNSFEQARVKFGVMSRKSSSVKTLDQQELDLPEFKFDHFFRLSDSTGILQHATYSVPNFQEGYCTDDVARALVLTNLLDVLEISPPHVGEIAVTCTSFLQYALNQSRKRFRNFMGFDRVWREEVGSEDSHGRAIWALGTCIGRSPDVNLQMMCNQLFEEALPVVQEFSSPRSWAFALIGIHEYFRRLSGDRLVNHIRDALTNKLMALFRSTASDSWPWFEDSVTYVNAKLPHALLLSGRWTNNGEAFEIGLRALRWLLEIQTTPEGYFRPIGSNGFYVRNTERQAHFDQQPIEAYSMMSACLEAFLATQDKFWYRQARVIFEWFLGRNDLGAEIYDAKTGGCRDALHVDRVNLNQGAESTLAFLLSLAEMRIVREGLASFAKPIYT